MQSILVDSNSFGAYQIGTFFWMQRAGSYEIPEKTCGQLERWFWEVLDKAF